MYHIKDREVSEEEYLEYASSDLHKDLLYCILRLALTVAGAITGCILFDMYVK